MGAPGPIERRWLVGVFAELCRIESPSGSESACAERVAHELEALGIEVEQDDAGPRAGSDSGNLLARIPGSGAGGGPWVMMCAHLDTVPLQAPVEPVLRDGFWENENEGILGADNKAAVAVLLALARHITAVPSPAGLELLFTVGEERSLAGSRAFDASVLRSEIGFVFDHATAIGEIVMASPTHYRLQASFRGAAAHAGLHPENGRSAILAASRAVAGLPLGRLDAQSTMNIGTIHGGGAINVVPEQCTIVGEVRSLEQERAEELAALFVDTVHEAANRPDSDCDVDVLAERTFSGYRQRERGRAVEIARAALAGCGYEPRAIESGGGSDANELILQGIETVNVANGTERAHEPGERVSERALTDMLDVSLALLDRAAALPAPGAL